MNKQTKQKIPKFLAILSGKGGVGKTTVAINLVTALTNFKRHAIVFDANLTTPNISIHLGSPNLKSTVHDVIHGRKEAKDILYLHPSGLKIMPGDISIKALKNAEYNENIFDKIPGQIKNMTEMVVLDSAAGLSQEVFASIKLSDEALIVATPDLPSVIDALKTIKKCEEFNCKVIGIILNRVRNDKNEMSIQNIEAMLEHTVIGSIPEDPSIRESLKLRHPVVYSHPESPSSVEFKKLAGLMIGQRYEPHVEKKPTIFEQFLKTLGLR